MLFELVWRPLTLVMMMAELMVPAKYHLHQNFERQPDGSYTFDAYEIGWIEECEGDSMTTRKVRLRINCYEYKGKADCYWMRQHLGKWVAGSPRSIKYSQCKGSWNL